MIFVWIMGQGKAVAAEWNAHAAYGDSWRLRQRVFDSVVFLRAGTKESSVERS
jgi:hypothetical protein